MFPYTKPPAGTQINPLHPLSKGLVGCWLFNEGAGSLANDLSGNKNHGTLTNMLPNAQGSGWGGSKFGGSLKFDGVDDHVDCGDNKSLNFATGSFSIVASIYIKGDNGETQQEMIVSKRFVSGGIGEQYYLRTAADYKLYFFTYNVAASSILTDDVLSLNTWYHTVATRDTSGLMSIYINGELSKSDSLTIRNISNDGNLWIGRNNRDSSQEFNGSIDSVHIYNRALSADEVKTLYFDPFCNMMVKRPSGLYVPSAAGGLSIPVAMHYYNQLARA